MAAGVPSDPLGGGDDLDAMADINVTPLVDVMLVLLIIFMVAAPLMLTGVPVDLPKTAAAKQNPPQKPLVVTLTRELALHIRDEPVSREELVPRLAAIKAAEGDAVAYVRADKAVPHGEVMATLGAIASAGYARISLLAQPAAGSSQISNTH